MQLQRILSKMSQAELKKLWPPYSVQDMRQKTKKQRGKKQKNSCRRQQPSRRVLIGTGQHEAQAPSQWTFLSHAFIWITNILTLADTQVSPRPSELTAFLCGDITSSNSSLPLLLLPSPCLAPRLGDEFVCAPTFEPLRPTVEKGWRSEVKK